MQRQAVLPAVLAALVAACLAGTAAHGLLRQQIWAWEGWARFCAFAAVYAAAAGVLIYWRPERALAWMSGFALLFTALAAGPLAAAGVLLAAAGAWAAGWLLWPRAGDWVQTPAALQAVLGLALWASLVMWTAALPIHYRWLYWLPPALAILAAWRRGWRPRLELPQAAPRGR